MPRPPKDATRWNLQDCIKGGKPADGRELPSGGRLPRRTNFHSVILPGFCVGSEEDIMARASAKLRKRWEDAYARIVPHHRNYVLDVLAEQYALRVEVLMYDNGVPHPLKFEKLKTGSKPKAGSTKQRSKQPRSVAPPVMAAVTESGTVALNVWPTYMPKSKDHGDKPLVLRVTWHVHGAEGMMETSDIYVCATGVRTTEEHEHRRVVCTKFGGVPPPSRLPPPAGLAPRAPLPPFARKATPVARKAAPVARKATPVARKAVPSAPRSSSVTPTRGPGRAPGSPAATRAKAAFTLVTLLPGAPFPPAGSVAAAPAPSSLPSEGTYLARGPAGSTSFAQDFPGLSHAAPAPALGQTPAVALAPVAFAPTVNALLKPPHMVVNTKQSMTVSQLETLALTTMPPTAPPVVSKTLSTDSTASTASTKSWMTDVPTPEAPQDTTPDAFLDPALTD